MRVKHADQPKSDLKLQLLLSVVNALLDFAVSTAGEREL